ncbi:MAG: hypothetical protein ACYDHM_14965 [Acidiferrobacterales bacterium]
MKARRLTVRDKTLQQLRAIARRQGHSGYSRLRKDELVRLLARKPPGRAKPEPVRKKKTGTKGTARRSQTGAAARGRGKTVTAPRKRTAATARPRAAAGTIRKPAGRTGPRRSVRTGPVVLPAGLVLPVPFVAADLGEDIESLPPLPDALLGLLPQKPGILHGYWALEPGTLRRRPDLRIRLCRIRERVLDVLDEIPLLSDSGRWYFHVGDLVAETQLYAQLGYYGADGIFITAIDRGIARLPSSHASTHTDGNWWISEAEFGRMYVRTGGRIDGQRLVWSASVSSH